MIDSGRNPAPKPPGLLHRTVVGLFRLLRLRTEGLEHIIDLTRWIAGFWAKLPRQLLVVIILTPLHAALGIGVAYFMKVVIDQMTSAVASGQKPEYLWPILLLIGVGVLSLAIYIPLQGTRAYVNMRLEWMIRSAVFGKLTTIGHAFFTKFRTGEVITRFTDDLDKVSWFSCSGVFRGYEALLYIVFGTAYLFYMSPTLTLICLLPLPIFSIVLAKTDSKLHGIFEELQGRISKVNNHLEVAFSGIRVLKTYRMEKRQVQKFAEISQDRMKQEVAVAGRSVIVNSMYMTIATTALLVIMAVGGYLVIKGSMPLGAFVSFYYAMLIVMGKIFEIGFLLISFRRTLVSVERIKALEQHEPDVREQRSPLTVKSLHVDIAFENVGFSYDGGPDLALSGVTFTVRRGQKIGIVGPVGSGKSTLLGLLPRLYDATEGKLLVDGVDIRQFRLESLRKRIGYVPQEPLLFSETLENNVIFGREGISPEMVRWACEVSQFANDLTSFPEGMQTKVGHRGMTLSGGQKQRLSIARALVTKPDVLILDDCSSALDASTEARLWLALAKELPGTTIFVVSHRIASVKDADLIVVFDHGKQVATGRHAQLLSEGIPVYRELVDAQLGATKAATECPEPPSPPDSDIGRAVV